MDMGNMSLLDNVQRNKAIWAIKSLHGEDECPHTGAEWGMTPLYVSRKHIWMKSMPCGHHGKVMKGSICESRQQSYSDVTCWERHPSWQGDRLHQDGYL